VVGAPTRSSFLTSPWAAVGAERGGREKKRLFACGRAGAGCARSIASFRLAIVTGAGRAWSKAGSTFARQLIERR